MSTYDHLMICLNCRGILVGGRQFKITSNDLIVINRIAADIGEQIYIEKVGSTCNVTA